MDRVIVLGWNFTMDIGQVIRRINDTKLDVQVIPPDALPIDDKCSLVNGKTIEILAIKRILI